MNYPNITYNGQKGVFIPLHDVEKFIDKMVEYGTYEIMLKKMDAFRKDTDNALSKVCRELTEELALSTAELKLSNAARENSHARPAEKNK
jgi:hypothetical protein